MTSYMNELSSTAKFETMLTNSNCDIKSVKEHIGKCNNDVVMVYYGYVDNSKSSSDKSYSTKNSHIYKMIPLECDSPHKEFTSLSSALISVINHNSKQSSTPVTVCRITLYDGIPGKIARYLLVFVDKFAPIIYQVESGYCALKSHSTTIRQSISSPGIKKQSKTREIHTRTQNDVTLKFSVSPIETQMRVDSMSTLENIPSYVFDKLSHWKIYHMEIMGFGDVETMADSLKNSSPKSSRTNRSLSEMRSSPPLSSPVDQNQSIHGHSEKIESPGESECIVIKRKLGRETTTTNMEDDTEPPSTPPPRHGSKTTPNTPPPTPKKVPTRAKKATGGPAPPLASLPPPPTPSSSTITTRKRRKQSNKKEATLGEEQHQGAESREEGEEEGEQQRNKSKRNKKKSNVGDEEEYDDMDLDNL